MELVLEQVSAQILEPIFGADSGAGFRVDSGTILEPGLRSASGTDFEAYCGADSGRIIPGT